MAMTSTEKQRLYRQRHLQDGTGCRLSMIVSASAKAQLERLARHYGMTQRAMLAQLLADAERDVVDAIVDTAAYYDGVTT